MLQQRRGRPPLIDAELAPRLHTWAGRDKRKRERVDLSFGMDTAPWDPERTLERYELLWEAGLVAEAVRDSGGEVVPASGRPLALDHRRILATALGRLRGKLKYRPVAFELTPPEFTLSRLQRVVEAISGVALHKQNFRRALERAGLVEGLGRFDVETGGRPAELFRFKRELLSAKPVSGLALPLLRE